jgi:hypothetical protein
MSLSILLACIWIRLQIQSHGQAKMIGGQVEIKVEKEMISQDLFE